MNPEGNIRRIPEGEKPLCDEILLTEEQAELLAGESQTYRKKFYHFFGEAKRKQALRREKRHGK